MSILNSRILHSFVLVLAVLAFAATATASELSCTKDDLPTTAADEAPVAAPVSPVLVSATPVAPAPVAAPVAHPWIPVGEPAEPSAAGDSGGTNDDDWRGSFQMYGFLSAIDGQLRARDRVVDVDRSFGDITDVLKFAVGVRLEGQYKKWGIAFDNNYVKLGDDVVTDQLLVPDYRFDLAMNVTEIEGTYRLYSTGSQDDSVGGPKFAIDALGGMRIVHLDLDLELRRTLGDDIVRGAASTYVHGYLGNRFIASPSKYVALIGRYNLSLASDLSWFVNGTVEIRPWEHVAFGAGLQVLDLSIEKDSADSALDARFFGPVFYLKFHF